MESLGTTTGLIIVFPLVAKVSWRFRQCIFSESTFPSLEHILGLEIRLEGIHNVDIFKSSIFRPEEEHWFGSLMQQRRTKRMSIGNTISQRNRALIIGSRYEVPSFGCIRVAYDTHMINKIHAMCWEYVFSEFIVPFRPHLESRDTYFPGIPLLECIPRLHHLGYEGNTGTQVVVQILYCSRTCCARLSHKTLCLWITMLRSWTLE